MTPLAAATATQPFPTGTVALLALVWAAGYLLASWWWPYKAHRRCGGTGKLRPPLGRAFRSCPSCRGTGRVLRAGRRLWSAGRDLTTRR